MELVATKPKDLLLGDIWKPSIFFNIDVFKENIDIRGVIKK